MNNKGFRVEKPSVAVDAVQMDQAFEVHDVVQHTVQKQTSYEPVLADRFYLNEIFKDVFGPTALTVDSTRTANNALIHGSPCSMYEDYNVYNSTTSTYSVQSAMNVCGLGSANMLTAPLNPKASVTRQALVTRACSDLVTNAGTFAFALRKIAVENPPAATEDNVRTLIGLFYRSQPEATQGLIDSIIVMLPQTGVTAENWRKALYTVCISSFWQVL